MMRAGNAGQGKERTVYEKDTELEVEPKAEENTDGEVASKESNHIVAASESSQSTACGP